MSNGSVQVFGPTGAHTWIQMMDINISYLTVKQLKEKAVKNLPCIPGQSEDNVQLTLDGRMLEESTPLFDCKFLPTSTIHLVLKVHGG
ncbi:hypothetical protein EXN66_Car013541 [Channa argus]|uniref:Ubiquitin-like domain-containing protein n=1 Tax=Channa argus TaxID=215402 RepID=A0A6G1Q5F4_CHAAH|nr:hypothetical protein EXN66_Car013541 [Channa argus]